MGLNMDQARGSTWTRDMARSGPGKGIHLDQGQGSTWTSIGLNLDRGMDMARTGQGQGAH